MVMTYARQKNNMNEPIEKETRLKHPARLQKNPPNVNARIGAISVKRANCGYAIATTRKTNNKIGIIDIFSKILIVGVWIDSLTHYQVSSIVLLYHVLSQLCMNQNK